MLQFKSVWHGFTQMSQAVILVIINFVIQGGFLYYVGDIVEPQYTCNANPNMLKLICVFSYLILCYGDWIETIQMCLWMMELPDSESFVIEVHLLATNEKYL